MTLNTSMKAFVASLFLIAFVSCNTKTEQKQYNQQQLDSIVAAEKNKEKLRLQAIQDSIAQQEKLQQEILSLRAQREGTENRLSVEIAKLEVEKDKLTTIKEPQFLRTQEEREEQIRKQSYLIQDIEKTIKNCNIMLDKIKTRLKEIDSEYSDEERIESEPPVVEF